MWKRLIETRAELASLFSTLHPFTLAHTPMPRVVLFKTPTTNNGTDAYEQQFTRAGFGVMNIPVLQETFHLEELTRIVLDSDAVWGGVVMTSKRGSEAWAQAAQSCKDTSSSRSLWIKRADGEQVR